MKTQSLENQTGRTRVSGSALHMRKKGSANTVRTWQWPARRRIREQRREQIPYRAVRVWDVSTLIWEYFLDETHDRIIDIVSNGVPSIEQEAKSRNVVIETQNGPRRNSGDVPVLAILT